MQTADADADALRCVFAFEPRAASLHCGILLTQPTHIYSQPSQGSAAQAQVLSLYVGWQGEQETLEVLGVAHHELTGSMVVLGPTLLYKPDGMVTLDHGTPFLSVRQHRVSCPPSLTSLKPITSVVLLLADAGKPGTARSAQNLCTALDALMAGEASTEQLLQQAQVIKDEAASWLHHLVNVMVLSSEVGQEFQGLWDEGASALAVQISNSETEQVQRTALKVQMQLWQQHFSPFLSDLAAVMTCVRMLTQYQPRELLGLQSGAVVGTQRGRVFSIGLRTLELARLLVDYLLQQPRLPSRLLQEVQQWGGVVMPAVNQFIQDSQDESPATQAASIEPPAEIQGTSSASSFEPTNQPEQGGPVTSASGSPTALVLPPNPLQPIDFELGDGIPSVRAYTKQKRALRAQHAAAALLGRGSASPAVPAPALASPPSPAVNPPPSPPPPPLPAANAARSPPEEAEQLHEPPLIPEGEVYKTPGMTPDTGTPQPQGETTQEVPGSSSAMAGASMQNRTGSLLNVAMAGFADSELETEFLHAQAVSAAQLDHLLLVGYLVLAALMALLVIGGSTPSWHLRSLVVLVLIKSIAFTSSLMPAGAQGLHWFRPSPHRMSLRSILLSVAIVLEATWWARQAWAKPSIAHKRACCNIHLVLDPILQPLFMRAPVRQMWLLYPVSVAVVAPEYCAALGKLPGCAARPLLAMALMLCVFVAVDAAARRRFVARRPNTGVRPHQE